MGKIDDEQLAKRADEFTERMYRSKIERKKQRIQIAPC